MGKAHYSAEEREKLVELIEMPENKLRGMTESTGLAILDAIYMLTETIREEGLRGLK